MQIQEIIKQIRETEGKATKGEWYYDGIGYVFQKTSKGHFMLVDDGNGAEVRMRGFGAELPLDENAELIVLMRNNIIPILDRLEELERENEELKKLTP